MNEHPTSATDTPALGLDTATLRTEYARATAALVRQRLWMTVALFLGIVGVTVILEPLNHPERRELVQLVYAAEVLASGIALWTVRRERFRRYAVVVAVMLGGFFGVCFTGYSAAVGSEVERIATAQVCLLTSLLVLLPWGWRAQVAVSLIALGGLVPLVPEVGITEPFSYALLAITAGAITSIAGAYYTDRYRFDAFARTALLTHTSAASAAILGSALDCIVTIDHRGRITEFNAAAERTFGYTRAEALGREMAALIIPPALREAHRRGLVHYLATGEGPVVGTRLEITAMRADGSVFPVELAIARVQRDGPPTFTGTLRDVTQRRQAEDALIAAKSRAEEQAEIAAALRHVGETLAVNLGRPDMLETVTALAVSLLPCDWAVTFMWDDRTETLRAQAGHGVRPDILEEVTQLAAIPARRSVMGAMRPGVLLEIAELRDRGVIPAELLRRWEVADALCAPIPGRADVVGFLCLGYRERHEAFTPRQRHLALGIAETTAVAFDNARLIADLQQANRLKSEFVSTMSHELRTPLNVILGFTEMARDPDLRGDVDMLLDRVDAAARELLDLVESTLAVGKLEAGRDDLHLETVRLPAFWQKLRDGFTTLARSPGVTLDWCPEVPDVDLTTDARKLAIVTRNLIGNALKFTEHGWVRASVRAERNAVLIEVADTGIGIRAEDHEAVFEMFRQADGSEVRRFRGTGLGLYIVRRFVERLGGTVSIASEPGKGSVFTVRLERC
jgi:PAS domain S-box-containing protein